MGLTKERLKKLENPKENANLLSATTFWWILPVLKDSKKYFHNLEDIYDPLSSDSSKLLGDQMERAWSEELSNSSAKPSLLKILFKVHKKMLIISGIMTFIVEFLFRLLTPICLIEFIGHFDGRRKDAGEEKLFYLSATGILVAPFVTVFMNHIYHLTVFHVGMKLRVAVSSLIYRKVLRLNRSQMSKVSTGHIINLLSNDCGRFDYIGSFFFDLWVGPMQAAIIAYCLYLTVGLASFVGTAVIVLSIPLIIWLGNVTSVLRMKTALKTDTRVRIMSEILVGIQVIKMYVWERPFEKLIKMARREEVTCIKNVSYIRGLIYSFPMFHTRIAIFLTLLTQVLLGGSITASQVFVLTSFFNVLQLTVADYFPLAASQISEFFISLKRIEEFLKRDAEDEQPKELCENQPNETEIVDENAIVSLANASVRWASGGDYALKNISFFLQPGQLVAVVGPVGAGKTTLLHTILGELQAEEGTVAVRGKVSYAAQEPWLFTGTVLENVLFGQEEDSARLKVVLESCAMDKDLSGLPHRERSLVGERGVTLSGGQRARLSLARAVYSNADIYLLDDPLSAVDSHVQKHLFEKCITGLLQGKSVILVTHQVQYLKNVSKIIVMENGGVKCQGTYDELQKLGIDLSTLLNTPEEPEEAVLRKNVSKNGQEGNEDEIENLGSVDEEMKEEVIQKEVVNIFWSYFREGGPVICMLVVFLIFISAQVTATGGDYWTSYWVNLEDHVYSDNTTLPGYPSRETCLYVFGGLVASTLLLSLLRSALFFRLCMTSSQRLHDKMFTAVSRSPMAFFNQNPSGRILNRFSKDVGNIDEVLPSSMVSCFQIVLSAVGVFAVVPATNVWLLVPTAGVLILFYLMRKFYLAASCHIKRIEGIARSPIYTHLSSTLQGLSTIHAFKAEELLSRQFDQHQDRHSATWYTFIAAGRAISMWLDVVCAIYNALVTSSFFLLDTGSFGGNVGLAITQTTGLTSSLQWGMRQSAEVENNMTSVERILEYTRLHQESPLLSGPGKGLAEGWPTEGKIKFSNLCLRYNKNSAWVLNDLSFTILPAQKVGVVGRTGAGKSSLISGLLRLQETRGSVEIDGLNTAEIGLWELRSRISVIPQEPAFFTGSLRYNLDPFQEYQDHSLWAALEEVELKDYVVGLRGGLDAEVQENGSNFSSGQKQLISLARALIRKNKILLLDEPTANVDTRTDSFIQETIKKKFSDCTVITIAHRLHSIMESDVIMVMDYGKLVEFGSPRELLTQPGFFYHLAEESGNFSELHSLATKSS